jgi:hypothetical protein
MMMNDQNDCWEMELCRDIWFVEMFGGYIALSGGEEQGVCQQLGKSEMLVLDLYCRVKRIRERRVGFMDDDDDDDDGYDEDDDGGGDGDDTLFGDGDGI